jgi:hypothetical protein
MEMELALMAFALPRTFQQRCLNGFDIAKDSTPGR